MTSNAFKQLASSSRNLRLLKNFRRYSAAASRSLVHAAQTWSETEFSESDILKRLEKLERGTDDLKKTLLNLEQGSKVQDAKIAALENGYDDLAVDMKRQDAEIADLKESTADMKEDLAVLKVLKPTAAIITLAQVIKEYQSSAIDGIFSGNKIYSSDPMDYSRFECIVSKVKKIKLQSVQTGDEQDFVARHGELVKKYGQLADDTSPIGALISQCDRLNLPSPDLRTFSKEDILIVIPNLPNPDPVVIKLIGQLVDEFK